MLTDEFMQAAKDGDVEALKRLAKEDPAVLVSTWSSGETPLMAALYRKHDAAAEWLAASGVALDSFAAAALGRVDLLDSLVGSGGSDVNTYSYDGWTPLHLAAFFGRRTAVERLLTAGAELNAVSRNALLNTPLHAAVAGGHVEVSLLLIESAADVNAVDAEDRTPLSRAAVKGHTEIVDFINLKE